jgi:hypothetical protein
MMRLEERDRALAMYKELGRRVIPLWGVKDGACQCPKGKACTAPGKHPMPYAMNWQNPENEYDLSAHTGNIGIAVHPEDVVLDQDNSEGLETLKAFEPLPSTWVASTGKGHHVWFRRKPGQEPLRNSVKTRDFGLDIRTKGGYVVVPPSTHKTGKPYEWLVPPNSIPCAELPDALDEAAKASQGKRERAHHQALVDAEHVGTLEHLELGRSIAAKHPPAIQGQGGNTGTCKLASMLKIGCNLTEDAVLKLMQPWNATCQPPWETEELMRLIGNMREGPDHPLGYMVEDPANVAFCNAMADKVARKQAKVKNNEVDDGKTEVVFNPHDVHASVAALEQLLPSVPGVYSMGSKLVRIATDGTVFPFADPSVLMALTESHKFVCKNRDGLACKLPTERIVNALLSMSEWDGVSQVKEIRFAPCLLPSGKVLTTGYAEGVLIIGDHALKVPEHPTQADAQAAAAFLLTVVKDFPLDDVGRAAWLALVFTLMARAAIGGNVPMFAVDANVAGAGKGKLVASASQIALGRDPHVISHPKDENEANKKYYSIVASLVLHALIDNIKTVFSDETLEALLTSGKLSDRVFRTQSMGEVECRTVFTATGNGLALSSPAGDCHSATERVRTTRRPRSTQS